MNYVFHFEQAVIGIFASSGAVCCISNLLIDLCKLPPL